MLQRFRLNTSPQQPQVHHHISAHEEAAILSGNIQGTDTFRKTGLTNCYLIKKVWGPTREILSAGVE